jgi:ankyrin repeat protein
MKCERLFFVIFLASVFLFTIFGLEAKGDSARTELEKKGYTYTESSFIECAKKGDIEAVNLFLAEGIDINAMNERGQIALLRAAEYQRTEVVTLLLEKGADVNIVGGRNARTALMEAAGAGNCVIIKQLVEKGADINAKDDENTTPIHFACTWGHVEAVRLLIELGAKLDIQSAALGGRTPMSLAESNGHIEIVQILKDAGAKE